MLLLEKNIVVKILIEFFIENHLSEEFLKKYKYKDLKFALERKKEFVKNYFD